MTAKKTATKSGAAPRRRGRRSEALAVAAAAGEAMAEGRAGALAKQGPLADLRQERFCLALLAGAPGTQAAIRAGYAASGAAVQASRMLRVAKIRARIATLLAATTTQSLVRRREMLRQLSDHTRWALADLAGLVGLGAAEFARVMQHHPAARWIREVEYHPPQYDRGSEKWSEVTVKRIKMADAHPSRRLLVEMMGWSASARAEADAASMGGFGRLGPGAVVVLPQGQVPRIYEAPESLRLPAAVVQEAETEDDAPRAAPASAAAGTAGTKHGKRKAKTGGTRNAKTGGGGGTTSARGGSGVKRRG